MIVVESPDLARLAAGAKVFGKVQRKAARKELAVIARAGAKDAKAKIRSMPVKGTTSARGSASQLRADIASAIRVSAGVNQATGASVRIYVANTAALKAHNRSSVARKFDVGPFRHPVYGRDTWVSQNGYPYFKSVISAKAPEMLAAAKTSLAAAIAASIPNAR